MLQFAHADGIKGLVDGCVHVCRHLAGADNPKQVSVFVNLKAFEELLKAICMHASCRKILGT